jgi:hypothetical protein
MAIGRGVGLGRTASFGQLHKRAILEEYSLVAILLANLTLLKLIGAGSLVGGTAWLLERR